MSDDERDIEQLVCTGLTNHDFEKRVKDIQHHTLEGLHPPQLQKFCYLCKRSDTDKSFVINSTQQQIVFPGITMTEHQFRLDYRVMVYNLCQECDFLLRRIACLGVQSKLGD